MRETRKRPCLEEERQAVESSSGPCCDWQGERSGGPAMYVYVAWDLESGWWEGGVGPSEPCTCQPSQPSS